MKQVIHITNPFTEYSSLCGIATRPGYTDTYHNGYRWDNGKPTCEACILLQFGNQCSE